MAVIFEAFQQSGMPLHYAVVWNILPHCVACQHNNYNKWPVTALVNKIQRKIDGSLGQVTTRHRRYRDIPYAIIFPFFQKLFFKVVPLGKMRGS
jgi:hypothetical protein